MSAGVVGVEELPHLLPERELAKAGDENFPVALRLLSQAWRDQLMAIYGYARFVDDVGDLVEGDRRAQLDWVEAELDRALRHESNHPIFTGAARVADATGVGRRPFVDLIDANRQDQEVTRYSSFDELLGYCALSANPVGRLVLAVFDARDELSVELSDSICSGLQIVEHLQDVGEDYASGRVYLPMEDLARFGVDVGVLGQPHATAALRRIIAFESARARALLMTGIPLVGRVPGRARLAIAGFIGGGLAQLEAIERSSYDVLGGRVKASRRDIARWAVGVLASRRARR